jgi:hypothetical protein
VHAVTESRTRCNASISTSIRVRTPRAAHCQQWTLQCFIMSVRPSAGIYLHASKHLGISAVTLCRLASSLCGPLASTRLMTHGQRRSAPDHKWASDTPTTARITERPSFLARSFRLSRHAIGPGRNRLSVLMWHGWRLAKSANARPSWQLKILPWSNHGVITPVGAGASGVV